MGAKKETSRGLSRARGKRLARLALAVCTALLFPSEELGQDLSLEYQMKAAYMGKIPSFVEWPASAANTSKTAFHLCTLGVYRFGIRLAQEVGKVTVGGRKIELRLVSKEQELDGCEMVFLSQSEAKRYGKILECLAGKSVLTVGETSGFLEAGGMVELSFEHDRLRMEVNLVAARSANLKVDARLLAMAKRVVTEHSTPGG